MDLFVCYTSPKKMAGGGSTTCGANYSDPTIMAMGYRMKSNGCPRLCECF